MFTFLGLKIIHILELETKSCAIELGQIFCHCMMYYQNDKSVVQFWNKRNNNNRIGHRQIEKKNVNFLEYEIYYLESALKKNISSCLQVTLHISVIHCKKNYIVFYQFIIFIIQWQRIWHNSTLHDYFCPDFKYITIMWQKKAFFSIQTLSIYIAYLVTYSMIIKIKIASECKAKLASRDDCAKGVL